MFPIDKETGFHLLESPLAVDHQIREVGDRFEICATVVDTAQLDCWLGGDKVRDVRNTPAARSNTMDR